MDPGIQRHLHHSALLSSILISFSVSLSPCNGKMVSRSSTFMGYSSSNIAEPLIAPGIEFHWFSLDYVPNAEPIIGVRGMVFFDWPG